jgi:hypothetical protein
LDLALTIKNALGVKLGYAFDGGAVAALVEVDDLLIGVFEWEDDRVGREGSEGGVEFLGACQMSRHGTVLRNVVYRAHKLEIVHRESAARPDMWLRCLLRIAKDRASTI